MNKTTKYVTARHDGMGAREAAKAAGYTHGVPSARARELYAAAVLLRRVSPDAIEWIARRLEDREREVAELKTKLAAARILQRMGRI
jgi:hypothetical protein